MLLDGGSILLYPIYLWSSLVKGLSEMFIALVIGTDTDRENPHVSEHPGICKKFLDF